MSTASRLAIILDQTMLEKRVPITPPRTSLVEPYTPIASPGTSEKDLKLKSGKDVAEELGNRYLLRYLLYRQVQVGALIKGVGNRQYVTPTPLAPGETVRWLNLPAPQNSRDFVLLIDPLSLPPDYPVLGPRWVYLGGGIEYVLPKGFPRKAIVDVGAEPDTKWELQIS